MHPHAVFQLDALQGFGAVVGGNEVFPRGHGGFFDKTIVQGGAERVIVNDVGKRLGLAAALHLRGGGKFQAQHGPQIVDGGHACIRPVAVRFIHEHHQIRQPGQIFEIALANILAEAANARYIAAGIIFGKLAFFIIFGGDFGNVENIDVHVAGVHLGRHTVAHANAGFVIVAGDNLGRGVGEFRQTFEYILGRGGCKVRHQLVVDSQVGGNDKKVADIMRLIQVSDKGSHKPGFAHARGNGKAQGGKIAVKAAHMGEFRLYGRKLPRYIRFFSKLDNLADAIQNFQAFALGFA